MTYLISKHTQQVSQQTPMYLSQTHGPIEITKMETQHLRNAICKKFRGVFAPLPRPYQEVINLLIGGCNRGLSANSKLSTLISSCCEILEWEDQEMFNLLTELYYRHGSDKATGGGRI